MNERIKIHSIIVTERNGENPVFDMNTSAPYLDAFIGRYKAALRGNVLILTHKALPALFIKYALSVEIVDPKLRRALLYAKDSAKANRVIQNVALLKSLQLVKKVNGAR